MSVEGFIYCTCVALFVGMMIPPGLVKPDAYINDWRMYLLNQIGHTVAGVVATGLLAVSYWYVWGGTIRTNGTFSQVRQSATSCSNS